MAEALAHPNSHDMATKINVDTITNASMKMKLGLRATSERHFEIPPLEVLECYFGQYSVSAKAYKTQDAFDPFFREIAKVLVRGGLCPPERVWDAEAKG